MLVGRSVGGHSFTSLAPRLAIFFPLSQPEDFITSVAGMNDQSILPMYVEKEDIESYEE